MMHFVTTRDHSYTVRHLLPQLKGVVAAWWSYERLVWQKQLPGGTWIFTDHERLAGFELALAARIAALLESGGARVLNHPGRVRSRFEILRRLKAEGINDFSVWRADSQPRPDAFPVFIRNEFDHWAGDLKLIGDQEALDATLAALEREGVPLSGKLVIGYAGEEVVPGVFQRLSSYRAGDAIIAHHQQTDFQWVVKDGEDPEKIRNHSDYPFFLERERCFVAENGFADAMARAFAIAGIDYGRTDFSLLGGRPQIFEINTNPMQGSREDLLSKLNQPRAAVLLASEDKLHRALVALDTPAGPPIALKHPSLHRQQKFTRRFRGAQRP